MYHDSNRIFQKLLYGHRHSQSHALTSNSIQSQPNGAKSGNKGTDNSETNAANETQRDKQIKYSKSKKIRDASKDTKLKLFLKRSSEIAFDGVPVNNQVSQFVCKFLSIFAFNLILIKTYI